MTRVVASSSARQQIPEVNTWFYGNRIVLAKYLHCNKTHYRVDNGSTAQQLLARGVLRRRVDGHLLVRIEDRTIYEREAV